MLIGLVSLCLAVPADADEPHYEIDIPAQTVAKALEQLASQTESITLFPFNLATGKKANAVRGRYTVPEALRLLLADTGLDGTLAEERIIGITLASNDSPSTDEFAETDSTNSVSAAVVQQPAVARQPSTDNAGMQQRLVEEIVVTGIRGSLQRSAEIKRRHPGIMDAITAEELGKFPDINVAESLQRITGVGITRTRGGEGQFVTVRGLGEEFNAVTFNGRLLATENNGREFSFDVIASELISGAEVFKSPLAEQGDGSLGGRVNIKTARPLDNTGFRAATSLSSQFEALSETWGPRATAVIANTFKNDTMGFIASVSYQDRSTRTDVAESIFLLPNAQVDADGLVNVSLDADGDGFNDTTGSAITHTNARFNSFSPSVAFSERKRIGGTASFQIRPSDATDIVFDALYTNFESPGSSFGYSYFPSAQVFTGTNATVNDLNQVVSFDIEPFALDLVTREQSGKAETIQFGVNVQSAVSDRITLTGDIAYSDADGNRDNFGSAQGSGLFYVLGYPEGPRISVSPSGGITPNVSTLGAFNIAADSTSFADLRNLTSDDIRLHFARNDTIDVEDEIIHVQGDVDWLLGDSQSVKFGIEFVDREKTNTAMNNVATQSATGGYQIAVAENSPQLIPGLLQFFDDGFLADAPGNFPRVFPYFSAADFRQARADAGFLGELSPVFDPDASSVVSETVLAAYFQFNLDGNLRTIPYNLNLGVRVAYTQLDANGSGGSLAQIAESTVRRDPSTGGFQAEQVFSLNPSIAASFSNDYVDVLPALNLSMNLRDNLIFRIVASRSLSRPTLTDLSTRFSITSNNPFGEQAVSSNPLLEAIRSNNFDLSLEWYGEGGGILSAAAFYKDISDFVAGRVRTQSITVPRFVRESDDTLTALGPTDIDFLISAPQNGDKAKILGLELGGQYFFDSGFGVSANVTFADSESESEGRTTALENISDFAYNASLFYEANGLQIRASVNHRSDYLIGQTVEGGLNEFGDDFTQADVSISYDVNDKLTVFVEGININDEEVIRLSEFADGNFLEAYEDNGARYVVGLRANF